MFSKYTVTISGIITALHPRNEAVILIFINYVNSVGCKLSNESNILHESSANMKETFNFLDCTMRIGFRCVTSVGFFSCLSR